jgi:two-component system OmpR family response regulator
MTTNHTPHDLLEDPIAARGGSDLIGLDRPSDAGDHDGEEGPTQYPLRVLIVDGDALVRRSWERAIRGEGLTVAGTGDREAALMLVSSFCPDVVILDLEFDRTEARSKGPGFFAQVRSRTNGFVIVLSDRDDELERVRVLRAGADDIWLQPVSNVELAVRLHALLRRRRRSISAELPQEFALPGRIVTTGPISIDLGRRTVELDGTGVPLTRIEFDLLAELCQQPREVCRREELLRAVWGDEIPGDGHVIDVHVSNLRRKLAGTAPGRRYIHTVRGVGFRLSDDVARPAGNLVVLRRA